jgi:hypothetical protein
MGEPDSGERKVRCLELDQDFFFLFKTRKEKEENEFPVNVIAFGKRQECVPFSLFNILY